MKEINFSLDGKWKWKFAQPTGVSFQLKINNVNHLCIRKIECWISFLKDSHKSLDFCSQRILFFFHSLVVRSVIQREQNGMEFLFLMALKSFASVILYAPRIVWKIIANLNPIICIYSCTKCQLMARRNHVNKFYDALMLTIILFMILLLLRAIRSRRLRVNAIPAIMQKNGLSCKWDSVWTKASDRTECSASHWTIYRIKPLPILLSKRN